MRLLAFLAMGVVLTGGNALAQTTPDTPVSTTPADERAWSFTASVFTYLLPDEANYGQPTFAADRNWLHVEARHNYEGRRASSAWLGYNISLGEEVAWTFTPMVGVVFGDTSGAAPGYKTSLTWRTFDVASEGEYVFDAAEQSDSFFYAWSEFGWTPVTWLRLGLVAQRTKVYKTDFEIEHGVLVGIAYKDASFTTYVFNPGDSGTTVVLGVSVSF